MSRVGRNDNPYRRKALGEVRKLAGRIRRKLHPERILLFGSLARGDAHALSDIDLVIIADFQEPRRDRVEQILDIAQALHLSFPIEPLPLRPEEFEKLRERPFFKHIAREAVEL